MPTVSWPANQKANVVAGLREFLGPDAEGLTDAEVERKALRRFAKQRALPVARRTATSGAVTSAERDQAAKERAAAATLAARKAAENAEDARVEAAFGSDS